MTSIKHYVMEAQYMTAAPTSELERLIGNISKEHDIITTALDVISDLAPFLSPV